MKKLLLIISVVLIAMIALTSCTGGQSGAPTPSPAQPGGMMGPQGSPGAPSTPYQAPYGQWPGGMMGPGMMGPGMMGGSGMMGSGMMGGWGGYNPDAEQITIDEAAEAAERYLNAYYGTELAIVEVMEFAWNFYAEVEEEDTGIHAMELLIDKYTGQVSPEMGPNMMWNTKYGMMSSYYGIGTEADGPISPEEARSLANKFLEKNLPGVTAGEAEAFYGYYTLHTLRDGQIEGMLSVNAYTGTVWYHSWHGPYIQMKEFEH